MRQNIKVAEITQFIETTHKANLEMLKERLDHGEWHWMFPTNWVNNESNRQLLFHAINSSLLPAPKGKRRRK